MWGMYMYMYMREKEGGFYRCCDGWEFQVPVVVIACALTGGG